jgi:hypothetical protein
MHAAFARRLSWLLGRCAECGEALSAAGRCEACEMVAQLKASLDAVAAGAFARRADGVACAACEGEGRVSAWTAAGYERCTDCDGTGVRK